MRKICLFFVFTVIIGNLLAVIAYPGLIRFKQPDGSEIEIYLRGDERVKWAETVDGYSLLFNAAGYYEYAVLDEYGDMVPSGISATPSTQRSPEDALRLSQIPKHLRFRSSQIQTMLQIWDMYDRDSRAFPTTGERKLICILMGFADRPFQKSQAQFNNLFNQIGYSYDGAAGCVKDFYLECSYNQLTLTTDIAGPYQASQNMAFYGSEDGGGNSRNLVIEAINFADPVVDFSEYDNDNNGWVDGVYIIFAGYGEEAGGPEAAIWSHAWGLESPVSKDGVNISSFACSPELLGDSGSRITSIGVICHEFGHTLGVPDYYDTNYEEDGQYQGTGDWDLMASGNWNNDGYHPAHHNGLSKVHFLHWAEYSYPSPGGTHTLQSAETHNTSIMRYETTTTNEYFVLENRTRIGFDAHIPGDGMIIYHVHSQFPSMINHTHPQRMYPVAQNAFVAQPNSESPSYGTINGASCAWTGLAKIAFTDTSVPSSQSWAGQNTGKSITNIHMDPITKAVSFDYMRDDPDGNYWTGYAGYDWFNPGSWSRNQVPTADHNVVIPGNALPSPSITGQQAACKNLVIGGGAVLGIASTNLLVYENFESYGNLILGTNGSHLLVSGDITWNTSATVGTWFPDVSIQCKGQMIFEPQSNVQLTAGKIVFFSGGANPSVDYDGVIINKSPNTVLNNVYSDKTTIYELVISSLSTEPFTINGELKCYQNRTIRNLYTGEITLKGNLISENTASAGIIWFAGTLRMAGTSQSVVIPHNAGYLRHLSLASNAVVTIPHNLKIKGNLTGSTSSQIIVDAQTLLVEGTFNTNGKLQLNHPTASFTVWGSITWQTGSTIVISHSGATLYCRGSMTFNNGSNISMDKGTVEFFGVQATIIVNKTTNTKFFDLRLNKTSPAALSISSTSTASFQISGSVSNMQDSGFNNYYTGTIYLKGNFTSLNTSAQGVIWDAGTLHLSGNSQTITLGHATDRLTSITVSSGTFAYLGSDVIIQGNLSYGGTLNAGVYTIRIGGNWEKFGSGVFHKGTSTVIFNGTGTQSVYSAQFNKLTLNKPGGGSDNKLLIGINRVVQVQSYKYEAGTIDVQGGTFEVYDLADNNVKGNYVINSGLISLTQDSQYFVDLDANLSISGGTILIKGGYNFPLDWAYTRPINITMSGGVLSFDSNSIGLTNTGHALNLNLSGGVIKTRGSFINNRTGCNINGGIVEMTGSGDATLSSPGGGSFYSVKINKAGSRDGGDRDRSNRVVIDQNLSITQDLEIALGTVVLNAVTANIGRDLIINGIFEMNNTGAVLNIGRDLLLGAISNAELTRGTINITRNFSQPLSSAFSSSALNTINFVGNGDSDLNIMNPSVSLGSIGVNKSSGNVALNTAAAALNLLGNLTVSPGNQFWFRTTPTVIAGALNVNGAILLQAGGSVTCYNLNMYGNITVAGDLGVQNDFYQAPGTQLIIGSSGNFIIDKPYTGSYQSFAGTTILNGGAITITNEGIQFGASSNLTINSGSLRIGWGLRAMVSNSFHMSTGTVEFIGSRTASIQLAEGNYLNNVAVSKTGSAVVMLSSDLLLRDLTINSGTLQLLHRTLNISGNLNIMNGTLDGSYSDDLVNINGWWNNNRGASGFLQGQGTVAFIGFNRSVIYQTEQFNNLRINKTSDYPEGVEIETGATLSTNSFDWLDGTLYLKGGATLNTPATGFTIPSGRALRCDPLYPSTINLYGDFADFNANIDDNNGFSSGKSTIYALGTGDRYISSSTFPLTLNGLHVNLSSGTCQIGSSNLIFTGSVHLQSGNLQTVMGGTIEMRQNFSSASGTNLDVEFGMLSFTGDTSATLGMLGSALCSSLNINKSGSGTSVSLSTDFTSPAWLSLLISSGKLDLNGHNLLLSGALNIEGSGILEVDASAALRLDSGSTANINAGGRFSVLGAPGQPGIISNISTGYYWFSVNAGGIIEALNGIFEYMNGGGIVIYSGASVDPVNSFTGCTFRNGSPGGVLLTPNNDQLITIANAVFPANTWSGNRNVSKYNSNGGVNFVNASGAYSGSAYEHDPQQRINWNNESPLIYVNQTSLSFNDTALTMSDYRNFSISNQGSGSLIGTINVPDGFQVSMVRNEQWDSSEKPPEVPRTTQTDYIVLPGQTINFQVTFTPVLPVNYNAYLTIYHNAAASSANIHLTGTGIGPKIALSPPEINRGILPGGYYNQNLEFSNSGNAALSYYASVEYLSRDRAVILSESFESSTFPPTNWSMYDMQGTEGNWQRSASTVHPSGQAPQDGQYLAYFNSWTAHVGHNTVLHTGYLDFSGYSSISLSFWMYHDSGYPNNLDRVQIMTQYNQQWVNVGSPVIRAEAPYGEWRKHTISLSDYAGLSYVAVAFLGISEYGNDIHIDNVVITGSNPPTGWVSFNGQFSNVSGYLAPSGSDQHVASIYTYGMDPGIYHARIQVATNDPIDPIKYIPIEISVGSPGISVTPVSLNFGNQRVGTSQSQNFSISATGGLHLNGTISVPAGYAVELITREQSTISPLTAADERWSSSLSYVLSPGETQTYRVRFTPTARQAYTGNVLITSDHLPQQTISLYGNGADIPAILTLPATSITSSSATLNAQITDTGGLILWGRGFRYGTDPDPIANGNDYMVSSTNNTYSAFPTGFSPGQQIYYCAFTYNELGWSYGDVLSFATLGPNIVVSHTALPGFGNVRITESSLPQSFTISGNDLSAPVLITAPNGFRVTGAVRDGQSRSPGNQLSIDPVGGVIPSTGVLVYFEPDLIGNYSGNITITSPELADRSISVSGTGITIPTVLLSDIADITQTSASSGGTVIADGASPVSTRGVCWSESPAPDISGSHSEEGSGSGSFTSNISGLQPGTIYYIRAYATNAAGTAYSQESYFSTIAVPSVSASLSQLPDFGNIILGQSSAAQSFIVAGTDLVANLLITAPAGFQISLSNPARDLGSRSQISISPTSGSVYATVYVTFTPLSGGVYDTALSISSTGAADAAVNLLGRGVTLPSVSTAAATEITFQSALTGGSIISTGWLDIIAAGVCWSTSPYPNLTGDHSVKTEPQSSFVDMLSGLQPNTLYYVRAYATNAAGTAYGNQISFTTLNAALGAPQNISILVQTGGVRLAWDAVSGAQSYLIYRSADPFASNWGSPLANTGNTFWVDNGSGGKYFYRITASSDPVRR